MRRRTLLHGGTGLVNISSAVVSASGSTYDGTAKTPAVTVTLNGNTIPSTGYDVAYSNNTNAGTATITVTGKDGYTGTATGTFTIYQKSLSVTASAQTITYGSSISQSTSKVSTSGLVSGDSLTSITLTQSTTAVTSSGTITPSNAATSNGISNYSVTYYTGNLTITRATGSITFETSSLGVSYNPYDTSASLMVSVSSSGWDKTTAKTVSGCNVFRSFSNKNKHNTSSVMKLTFVNNTGAAVSKTVKVGPATEGSYDYVYIAQWGASDISPSSSTVPSFTIYSGSGKTAEWTDVSITIPTGTNTLQIVYRKDSSVSNAPDCGYFALPYDVNIASLAANSITKNTDASVSYSSSNTGVVSVNSSTGVITVNGVGTATITASASATTNYSSCSGSYTITVSAYKVSPTYTAPSTKSLTYSGSAQYLTTSGSTSHGTIYYSTDNSNWYTSRRTGTNAGSYSCYWKLSGDTYHSDVAPTYLGTTTIAKKSRTISWSSKPTTLYVGSKGTLSATVSAGSGDGTISYSSSSSSKASVSGSTVTAVASGSCTIYASVSEGTNYLSASTSYSLTVNAVPSGYVNMGVSVLWAEKNVGASSAFTYSSSFFSWGNTDAHTPSGTTFSYDWGSSSEGEPYKSTAGAALTSNIGLSNDAARQTLGSPCRMPTSIEFKELFDNSKFIDSNGNEITSSSNKLATVNGVVGVYLKSKTNGNRLFFPCCGFSNTTDLLGQGTNGVYYSSTYYSSTMCKNLYFATDNYNVQNNGYRFRGCAIRAVRV